MGGSHCSLNHLEGRDRRLLLLLGRPARTRSTRVAGPRRRSSRTRNGSIPTPSRSSDVARRLSGPRLAVPLQRHRGARRALVARAHRRRRGPTARTRPRTWSARTPSWRSVEHRATASSAAFWQGRARHVSGLRLHGARPPLGRPEAQMARAAHEGGAAPAGSSPREQQALGINRDTGLGATKSEGERLRE